VTTSAVLHGGLMEAARRTPNAAAVIETDGTVTTFDALATITRRAASAFGALGVLPGDRIAIHLPKSVDAVAAICGTLLAGGMYVPVDPRSPLARAAYIIADSSARLVVTTQASAGELQAELLRLGAPTQVLALPQVGHGLGLETVVDTLVDQQPAPVGEANRLSAPACILYTSGSTGRPKGVVLSHGAVLSFVNWALQFFRPDADDRFASHAPFHFDLSLFDLFVAQHAAAPVVLFDEDVSRNPRELARLIAQRGITIWYSTPSVLSLLLQHGSVERHDHRSLRLVLFAGEVFPVSRLRQLMTAWSWARFFNLYGPTETNVCTWHEVPSELPSSAGESLPIGQACSHAQVVVWGRHGPAPTGDVGELLVRGSGVMSCYWNLPDASAAAFLTDHEGIRWYRTGDRVHADVDGTLWYHGRSDRMVKRRGYRIELAEIERVLCDHPMLGAVAVIARSDERADITIDAFLTLSSSARPSIIELRQYLVSQLPSWMLPDRFEILESLPMTSTGKIDLQVLRHPAASC